MNYLQSLIIGAVSGFAELLPVSAETHRAVLRCLMGMESEDPLSRLVLHIAALAALVWCVREELVKLRKTQHLAKIPRKRRRRQPDLPSLYTIRLLKTAAVFLTLGRLFTTQLSFIGNELQFLAFCAVGNGILLLIPGFVPNGNKDPRNMPRLDGIVMGLGAALSVIPGFSQVAGSLSTGIARGVDKKFALKFTYLLLIPGLMLHILFDLLALIGAGGAALTGAGFAALALGGLGCFVGSYLGYKLMNFLAYGTNFTTFGYYSFGVGLFSFVLFLTI